MILKCKDTRIVASEVTAYRWVQNDTEKQDVSRLHIYLKSEDLIIIPGPKTLLGQFDQLYQAYLEALK